MQTIGWRIDTVIVTAALLYGQVASAQQKTPIARLGSSYFEGLPSAPLSSNEPGARMATAWCVPQAVQSKPDSPPTGLRPKPRTNYTCNGPCSGNYMMWSEPSVCKTDPPCQSILVISGGASYSTGSQICYLDAGGCNTCRVDRTCPNWNP